METIAFMEALTVMLDKLNVELLETLESSKQTERNLAEIETHLKGRGDA